ncbi:ImmA/IrrE family metallo-endopeptidase [Halobacterium wangiae]|uniref:ImmA/IrrE family metallo-endopeptidase n=1 Tax=Halobacterium wangiae TaxID=2902623 RepID=UPI001E4C49E1|nr:DUF955 domain-containing protein [Halobacterium wangiae]
MSQTSDPGVCFEDFGTRRDEMHQTINEWIEDLAGSVGEARASAEFQDWLNVQSQFHDYSYRNTLLIRTQCLGASRVAGYHTWQNEFERHVKVGESAIWIWAPIITKQCPNCGKSPTHHERGDCEYNDLPTDEWPRGLVGFRPTAVFDVSQTEGEPLPELDTEARGDALGLVTALIDAGETLNIDVCLVEAGEWEYGDALGVCTPGSSGDSRAFVEVKACSNQASMAGTLIHEYAHALLHTDIDETERSKREVEAEAVAHVVGRYYNLDTSGSAFYLAAWEPDNPEIVRERLERITRTATRIIDAL